jgi:thioredoxin reductase (NADPH)
MLTPEELVTIPLFSTLPADELEQLAKRVADIHLTAGEYAVHEGEERALFAVLAGKIEVTKQIDGIERTIGWRAPGKIFGEVPIALGGPFIGSYRAAEDTRVIRVEAPQYYALAAASPEISEAVGARSRASASVGCRTSPPRHPRRR